MRTVVGFLFALFLFMTFGCSPNFANSRETCLGKADSAKEAVQLVMPHLTNAMLCASQNIEDDKAAVMCVQSEFEAMKTEAEPVVRACAMTLLVEAVAAGKK